MQLVKQADFKTSVPHIYVCIVSLHISPYDRAGKQMETTHEYSMRLILIKYKIAL